MGGGVSVFLSDDSGSVTAEYALLFPLVGAALVLVIGQAMQSPLNPQCRLAVKATVRRRGS